MTPGWRGKYSVKVLGGVLLCCLRRRRHHPCLILQICPSLHPLHHNSPWRISVLQQERKKTGIVMLFSLHAFIYVVYLTVYLLFIIMTYFFLLIQVFIRLLLNNKRTYFPHLCNLKKTNGTFAKKTPKHLTITSFPSSLSRTLSLSLSTDTSGQIRYEREGENKMLHLKNPWWQSYRRLRGRQVRRRLVPWKLENQSGTGVVCPRRDPERGFTHTYGAFKRRYVIISAAD